MICRNALIRRLALCLGASLFACTAAAATADEKRNELKSVRDQIRALQRGISADEETHADAVSDLAEVDRAVSESQRRLREIGQAKVAQTRELARLNDERTALEAEIARQRRALGGVIYRMYVEGGQAGARRLLSGDDPNQLSRDAYYLEQIARQRADAIEAARVSQDNLRKVIAAVEAERAKIAALEAQALAEQQKLVAERARQKQILEQASDELRTKRREMASLQRDQERLTKLIQGLDEIARKAAAERAAKAAAAARASASSSRAAAAGASRSQPPRVAKAEPEPVTGRAESVAVPGGPEIDFVKLRGRLQWPVRGELTGRFGAPMADGGSRWRGVFIRSAPGADIHAVASGLVAYADWLRGFGNIIIIDHGDGYMTIYGNADALYKTPGQEVKTGETIASVGSSGGAQESGLYFEIRHRGEPSDPIKWMAGR